MGRFALETSGVAGPSALKIGFEDAESAQRLDLGKFFHVNQVHGRELLEARAELLSVAPAGPIGEADGVWASVDTLKRSGLGLLVKSADCGPLIYFDASNGKVAAVHAGWRGLALGIHLVPFELGFDPVKTLVWLGPCLSGNTFEVGEDMWSQFPKCSSDPRFFALGKDSNKRFFNAWDFIEHQMREAGVLSFTNLKVNTLLTPSFNSYRRARQRGLPKSPGSNYSWVAVEDLGG